MRNLLRSLGVAALLILPARADDWTHLGRDAGRRRAPVESILAPAPLGSPVGVGGEVAASPVAADGYLVVADLAGRLHAFRESDLAPMWTVVAGGSILSTPIVDRGRVYVLTGDGELRVYRLADGGLLWTLSTGGADLSSAVLSGNRLFFGSGIPVTSAVAVDVDTHAVVWTGALEQVTNQSPALAGGNVILGCNSGLVTAFAAGTGQIVWTYASGGTGGPGSSVVDGNSLYLVSDGTLQRVDLDPAAWASSNWSVSLTDPAPPSGALAVEWAASSPAMAGTLVCFVARFTYAMDDDHDGYPDRRVLREFAIAVDPATRTARWQVPLGTPSVPDMNGIPPFLLCPSPVDTGSGIAFASSVDASLRILAAGDGSVLSTFALDAPCLASPMIANARLIAVTRAGTIHSYQGTDVQPAAATGLDPDNVHLLASPADLTWTSAGAGATYLVRMAKDGEILMDWDFEGAIGSATTPCPALQDGYRYTWSVRVRSASGAWSPWSTASFIKGPPPQPPGTLTATPDVKKVHLSWTASPSPSTAGYRLAYGESGGPLGTVVDLGTGTSTTVSGLLGATDYTFELRALDGLGLLSTPVTASATTLSTIRIGATGYASLADALAAAGSGDVVTVGADTITIDQTLKLPAGVELRGLNALDSRIVASGAIVMIDAKQGSTVSGLTLSAGLTGIQANGSGVTVRNTIIRNMSGMGIESLVGTTTAINNTIVNNVLAGIEGTAAVVARNNILQGNGVGLSGGIASTYNDVSDGYLNCAAGTGDRSTPVLFLDAGAGDYREQANQPSLDAGAPVDAFALEPTNNGGRVNMGAFGNTPLAATSPAPATTGGLCGLTGLEVLVLLAFLRRRR